MAVAGSDWLCVKALRSNLRIKENSAYGLFADNYSEGDGHVIQVRGEGIYENYDAIKNVTIDSNYIANTSLHGSENITIVGNVKDWQVSGNFIEDIKNIAIDAIGGEQTSDNYLVDVARYGFIEGNIVVNFEHPIDDGPASAIYVDGGRYILVKENETYNTPMGFAVGAEECATAKHVTITNNEAHGSYWAFGDIFAGAFYDDNGYAGYDKSINPYNTYPCNEPTINGKGYVEHITITGNYFPTPFNINGNIGYIRLTHASIDSNIGYPQVNHVNTQGYAPTGTNENAIKYP